MSYRVFARKYRPRTFEEVIGQEHITRTLQNAIRQDRIAQAYLLVGPRGIGKTSTARILAKALNCRKGTSPTPCCECSSCLEIAEGRNLDVIEIDGASNNGVENIRDLRDNAQYTPAEGPFKIYLVDEVHMLTIGAFNALLKTLEEPPPHVKFIFATTEAQKLPATITSRCQRFDLRRIPDDLIASHLGMIADKEGIRLQPDAAAAIAVGANGGLRDAESMLDQVIAFCGGEVSGNDVLEVFGFTAARVIEDLFGAILRCEIDVALRLVAEQDAAGKDLARLVANLVSHCRDLLVAQATEAGSTARLEQAGIVSREKLLELLEHFAACESQLRWAADKRMQVDVAAIKAVHLIEQASLTEVIETISSLRDSSDAPQPVASARRQGAPSASGSPKPAPPAGVAKSAKSASPARAAKAPGSTPSPAPPTPSAVPAAEAPDSGTNAEEIWARVVSGLAAQSPFRFGWLEAGVFQVETGGRVVVEFSDEFRECAEASLWEEPQLQLDRELSEAYGRAVKFHCEFIAGMAPPADREEPDQEKPQAPQPQPAGPPKQPAADEPAQDTDAALESFKNDPLIRKALDMFQAEIISSKSV